MFSIPGILAQILSVFLDLVGLLAIISIVLFLFRRFVQRPTRLDNRPEDLIVLLLILTILLTGMLLESLRLSVIGLEASVWAPIGFVFSQIIQLSGITGIIYPDSPLEP